MWGRIETLVVKKKGSAVCRIMTERTDMNKKDAHPRGWASFFDIDVRGGECARERGRHKCGPYDDAMNGGLVCVGESEWDDAILKMHLVSHSMMISKFFPPRHSWQYSTGHIYGAHSPPWAD